MKNLIIIAIIIASGLLMGGVAFAGGEGTSSGVFLTLPSGPVAAALAGSGATAGGPSALYDNPAGLTNVDRVSNELSHAAWLEGLNYDVFSAAVPFGSFDTVAIGVRYMGYGSIDASDNTGFDAGHIAPRDMVVSAGYARAFADGWSAGLAGKYIESRITVSAFALALDGGLQYRQGGLVLGAALTNLGGKLKYVREAYPLPLTLNTGASYRLTPAWTVFAEGDSPRSGLARVGGGAERYFRSGGELEFVGRLGYSSRYSQTGGVNGLSGGIGLVFKSFKFDYAFSTLGELGFTHHFGVGLRWGGPKPANDEEISYMGVIH